MAESFLQLSRDDQREILALARDRSNRPAHLLEKDVWVVWTLNALFSSPLAADLTFKGGTSLSKAYKVIERFSEDIDLTYDIRKLIGDLVGREDAMPASRSQANKWTKAVRERLPQWIAATVRPVLEAALTQEKLAATLEIGGEEKDKLLLRYPALSEGTGYVAPVVVLEFGARATGEPHHVLPIACDMEGQVPDIAFPTATPLVMSVARTFWEKATAAHVYCAKGRIRSERYARHWYDLVAIAHSRHFSEAITDREVATAVALHKSMFFAEKDIVGNQIDYLPAVRGYLRIVPEGEARTALAEDYARMVEDQILLEESMPFDEMMQVCTELESNINRTQAL